MGDFFCGEVVEKMEVRGKKVDHEINSINS
jgi:hypothetical protein